MGKKRSFPLRGMPYLWRTELEDLQTYVSQKRAEKLITGMGGRRQTRDERIRESGNDSTAVEDLDDVEE